MTISEIVLRGVLSSVYKMDDGEITQLLQNEDGNAVLTQLLDKDKTRIQELRTNQYQDGFKAAKKEVLGTFEKSLRDKFGITDTALQGESLIESIVTAQIEKERTDNPPKNGGKITDDEIKKHPLYLALEQDKTKAVTQANTDWETKYNDREAAYQKDSRFATVKEKALSTLNGEQWVYPEDATVAQNQRGFVIAALQGYEYEEVNGVTYPIKDGKRQEDGHGNPITLDEFITSTAKQYIPIKVSNGGTNPPPANGGGTGGGAGKAKYVPKDEADYIRYIADKSNTLEDRNAVAEEYGNKF